MEDMLIQSANMEIALWQNFGTGRTANATALLAIVVAVWVAARFSSVSLEKNVNLLGKVFVTAFAVGVFMMGLVVYGNIGGTFEGHAAALAGLDAGNGDILILVQVHRPLLRIWSQVEICLGKLVA